MPAITQFRFDNFFNYARYSIYDTTQFSSFFCRGVLEIYRYVATLLCNLIVLLSLFFFSNLILLYLVFEEVDLFSSSDNVFLYFTAVCIHNILFRFTKDNAILNSFCFEVCILQKTQKC